MLKTAKSYILIQEMVFLMTWILYLYQIQWNCSNYVLIQEIDENDVFMIWNKEENYYKNNYTANLSIEIKLWQKLQISFSFCLTGSYGLKGLHDFFFPLANCAWFFSLNLLCRNFFWRSPNPPPPPPSHLLSKIKWSIPRRQICSAIL